MTMQVLDGDFYSSLGLKYEEAFARNKGLLDFLSQALRFLPPRSNILDAGCGTGKPVASTLAAAGHRVTGIDISPKMIELSRQAVPTGEFMLADMREYTPPKQLDAVFNILSLSLFTREEMEEMTARWSTWIAPGGLLFITTLAAEDCQPEIRGHGFDADHRCARNLKWRFFGSEVQSSLMTRAGWEALLLENGFQVVETSTSVFVPPVEIQGDDEPHYYIIAWRVNDWEPCPQGQASHEQKHP